MIPCEYELSGIITRTCRLSIISGVGRNSNADSVADWELKPVRELAVLVAQQSHLLSEAVILNNKLIKTMVLQNTGEAIQHFRTETKHNIGGVKDDLGYLRDFASKFEDNIMQIKENVANTKEDVQHVRDDANFVQDKIANVTAWVEQVKNDVGKVKKDVGKVKMDVGKVKMDEGKVKKDVGQVRNDVGQVRNDVVQVKDQMGQMIHDFNTNTEKITDNIGKVYHRDLQADEKLMTMQDTIMQSVKSFFIHSINDLKQLLVKAKDCFDIQQSGITESGIHEIHLGMRKVKVYCDMSTDGGGWTVFLRRKDTTHDFPSRTWFDYVNGFGDLGGSFWLGNKMLHHLTANRKYTLRVDLQDWEDESRSAHYEEFSIESEEEKFKLHLAGYSGTAGDSLSSHNGAFFSTIDVDNDRSTGHCAEELGAWWYDKCGHSQLTGEYLQGTHEKRGYGIRWSHWKGHLYSFMRAEMKIRPVDVMP